MEKQKRGRESPLFCYTAGSGTGTALPVRGIFLYIWARMGYNRYRQRRRAAHEPETRPRIRRNVSGDDTLAAPHKTECAGCGRLRRTRLCQVQRVARRQPFETKGIYHDRRRDGKPRLYRSGQEEGGGRLRAAPRPDRRADQAGRGQGTCRRKRLPHRTRRLRRDDGRVSQLYQRLRDRAPARPVFSCGGASGERNCLCAAAGCALPCRAVRRPWQNWCCGTLAGISVRRDFGWDFGSQGLWRGFQPAGTLSGTVRIDYTDDMRFSQRRTHERGRGGGRRAAGAGGGRGVRRVPRRAQFFRGRRDRGTVQCGTGGGAVARVGGHRLFHAGALCPHLRLAARVRIADVERRKRARGRVPERGAPHAAREGGGARPFGERDLRRRVPPERGELLRRDRLRAVRRGRLPLLFRRRAETPAQPLRLAGARDCRARRVDRRRLRGRLSHGRQGARL